VQDAPSSGALGDQFDCSVLAPGRRDESYAPLGRLHTTAGVRIQCRHKVGPERVALAHDDTPLQVELQKQRLLVADEAGLSEGYNVCTSATWTRSPFGS